MGGRKRQVTTLLRVRIRADEAGAYYVGIITFHNSQECGVPHAQPEPKPHAATYSFSISPSRMHSTTKRPVRRSA